MSKEIKKFHENVLSLDLGGDYYTIHRRNIAGIEYSRAIGGGYLIKVALINPLKNNSTNKVFMIGLADVTFEDYLEYVDWFDNPRPHYHSYSELEGGKLL